MGTIFFACTILGFNLFIVLRVSDKKKPKISNKKVKQNTNQKAINLNKPYNPALEDLNKRIEEDNKKLNTLQLSIEKKHSTGSPESIQINFNGLPYKFDEESFTAFDFETADDNPESVIKLSIAHFKGNNLTDIKEYYCSPINSPEVINDNYKYTITHGIKPSELIGKPNIIQIWEEIEPQLNNKHLIAHNIDFDINILKDILTIVNRPLVNCYTTCTSYYSKLSIKWMYTLQLDLICEDSKIPYWGNPSRFKAVSTGILFIYLSTLVSNKSFNRFITGKKTVLKPLKNTN